MREEDIAGTNLVDHLVGSRDDNPARQARQDEGEEVMGSNGLVSAVAQSQGLLLWKQGGHSHGGTRDHDQDNDHMVSIFPVSQPLAETPGQGADYNEEWNEEKNMYST